MVTAADDHVVVLVVTAGQFYVLVFEVGSASYSRQSSTLPLGIRTAQWSTGRPHKGLGCDGVFVGRLTFEWTSSWYV